MTSVCKHSMLKDLYRLNGTVRDLQFPVYSCYHINLCIYVVSVYNINAILRVKLKLTETSNLN